MTDVAKIFERSVYGVELEIREDGTGGQTIIGFFPYNARAIIGTGKLREETFLPGAFEDSLSDSKHEIDLLFFHDKNQPLASRSTGTLQLRDTASALEFTAKFPTESEQPTWIQDAVKALRSGFIRGISPGFKVVKQQFDQAGADFM